MSDIRRLEAAAGLPVVELNVEHGAKGALAACAALSKPPSWTKARDEVIREPQR